jgi:hypothetical protein
MEDITAIGNSLKRISRKIQRAINLNELDFKIWPQVAFASLNHDPKR